MKMFFVEAGQTTDGPNWGKFAIGVPEEDELLVRPRFPGCERERPLMRLHGPGRGWVWVMDLETGEAAMFRPGHGLAEADLNGHRIWVCVLFEPFLCWLYEHAAAHGDQWWEHLPETVLLPGTAGALYGHRRPGPRA